MADLFSDYLRALDDSGSPPGLAAFDEVWAALGRALRHEIQKRGLWDSPPAYLGVVGWPQWALTGDPSGRSGAMEDLLAECYTYIFVRRLDSLQAQLRHKPNIEGLVFLNIRNFLHELQRRHDPMGFRMFEMARGAVRSGLRAGDLHVVSGDPQIRNGTVLSFEAGHEPEISERSPLEDRVAAWNDLLLPDLVTARGKAQERVVGTLHSLLLDLRKDGVEGFSFAQLIDPLKADVRGRWSALLEAEQVGEVAIEEEGELLRWVRAVTPEHPFEEEQALAAVAACLLERLEEHRPASLQAYLSRLWEFLRAWAAESGHVPESPDTTVPDSMPSARQLSRWLSIPRERIPSLLSTLRELYSDCRAATSRKPAVNLSHRGLAPVPPTDGPERRVS